MIDMRPEWLRGLREWAQANGAVRQVWLFGSRARGDAREDSDVDIALALMPPDGKTDWALGAYSSLVSVAKRKIALRHGRFYGCSLFVFCLT